MQLELFSNTNSGHKLLPTGVDYIKTDLSLQETTFKGGLDLPVHCWYKLRPSFSPYLVSYLLDLIQSNYQTIIDPFAGAGTTLIEGKNLGYNTIGVELNPFLAEFIGKSLNWHEPKKKIKESQQMIQICMKEEIDKVSGLTPEQASLKINLPIPPIHNVNRWWRSDVLTTLLAIKSVLKSFPEDSLEYRLLWLALGTACIEVANIKRLHPTLTFFDRSGEDIKTDLVVLNKLSRIVDDLLNLTDGYHSKSASIIHGDSLQISQLIKLSEPVILLTSPPYPNRYSYVWETRPHLYMMDLIQTAKEAAELDLKAPGGTWGVATSVLAKGIVQPQTDLLAQVLNKPLQELRSIDNLMANYITKYFNMMDTHFDQLEKCLPPRSILIYIVGNSRIKGVDIHTDLLFTNMLSSKSWITCQKVINFRKRIGRKDLFETAIIAQTMG